jgi:hypothetical protein
VQLYVVVPVLVLSCSERTPDLRIKEATGGRNSVLAWAATTLQSEGGRRVGEHCMAREVAGERGGSTSSFIGPMGKQSRRKRKETLGLGGMGRWLDVDDTACECSGYQRK